MPPLRALVFLATVLLPASAATFGTVVTHTQPISDLLLDETPGRTQRLYVLNTAANAVEVYSRTTNPPRLSSTVKTDSTPLAMALSRSGRYLYVVCYAASSLQIIDLTTATFSSRSVTLPASPEAVAVGFNDIVLISTIGTGTGQSVLLTFNPAADAAHALSAIPIAPPAPAAPTLTGANIILAQAARAKLQATADGKKIIGVHMTGARTVFVFDVASATVLRARSIGGISSVLAVSPDGSQFVSGPQLFDANTMAVLAQQNTINAPFVFPNGVNFNSQVTQGGAVYATTALGPQLITGYNIVPVQNPAARSNTSQLFFNTTDSLLIQLGIMLPETQSGKMVATSDGATVYAISQSGFLALPLSTLPQSPIALPDSNVALLVYDQCGLNAAKSTATIPVRNIGGGRVTLSSAVVAQSATSTQSRVSPQPYGGDVTASLNAAVSRNLGTVAPDQLLIQSSEAINVIPNVRVFQNSRNTETRGTILPVDVGATTTGLTDMVTDNARQRLYIANPGLNRLEVFDMRAQKFLDPIRVGQLPRSIAMGGDGNTLYVANSGGESIVTVDLTKGAVSGSVAYPPLWFNSGAGVLTPQIVAYTTRGPHVLMSDGTLWKIVGGSVEPRALNTTVFGTARAIPGPQSMASSADGNYLLVLAGNGSAYLYDATIDDFVTGRTVVTPGSGYFGPIAAGSNGLYYLANDQLLNAALTPVTAGGTGPVGGGGLPNPSGPVSTGRPVAAVAALGAQSFARYSAPLRASSSAAVSDAGLVEVIDVQSQRTTATAPGLELPLLAAVGTSRAIMPGRLMAVDPSGTTAYIVTASGLSIIPLTATADAAPPAVPNNGVVNTASYTAGVAPGSLVSIFGRNLGQSAAAGATPLPTVLGGVCVTLNNAPLPLLASSAGQINAQLPPTLAAGRYPLVVRSVTGQGASSSVNVTVAKYAPAIFVDPSGPAIFHANGQRVDHAHPANRDEPLTIYATGLGTTTGGKVTAGNPAPSSPLAVTAPVSLFFGDPTIKQSAVIVDWSGLLPGYVGVYQINARVPGFHEKGDSLPVTLRIGGVSSPTTGATAARVTVN
jgi:uncharacterized protein (TIGR03437 family)